MTKIDSSVLRLVKKLGIKIIWTNEVHRSEWEQGKEILINPRRATNYDVLHEVGHSICGYGCCREHCEFEAHGGAKVLLKLLGLNKGNAEVRMDSYAGRTKHVCCGRIELNTAKDKKKKGKKLTKYEKSLLKKLRR